MKTIIKSLIISIALAVLSYNRGNAALCSTRAVPVFRVTGYLPLSSLNDGSAINFNFSRINYLNIAFINPDKNGDFTIPVGLSAVVRAAHANQTKVLLSIGGGSAPSYYSLLIADNSRSRFIMNIMKLVTDTKVDGIDVDLEGDRIDNNYESFVTEVSQVLKPAGKQLTAAIATVYQARYSDKALAAFDFINIMSYDKTGPWNLSNPGQHAPYEMAVSDLDYWINIRGLAKEKTGLGLPFYGYGFGTNAPQDISYNDLLKQFPGAANTDQVYVPGGGIIYYNGLPTIKKKTILALKSADGIMIWQLMQDATGPSSLLDSINQLIKESK